MSLLHTEFACSSFTLLLIITLWGPCSQAAQFAQNRTAAAVQCTRQVDTCRCETASGHIDLSPLAKSGDQFAFSDRLGPSGMFHYFFNPCFGVTCDGSTEAAVCQKNPSKDQVYLLGTQRSATFETDPSVGLILKYTGLSGDNFQRETRLQLVCDTSGSGVSLFTPLDDGVSVKPIVYKMSLLSGYCCEVAGPVPGGGGGGGLSGGDILLIVFFSLAFAYVTVGLAVNLAVRKRSGSDALPNVAFWTSLPGLVGDGAKFTFRTLRTVVTRRQGEYQSV